MDHHESRQLKGCSHHPPLRANCCFFNALTCFTFSASLIERAPIRILQFQPSYSRIFNNYECKSTFFTVLVIENQGLSQQKVVALWCSLFHPAKASQLEGHFPYDNIITITSLNHL